MKLAWLSPLPPTCCRTAEASRALLPAVARHDTVEVTAWTPTRDPVPFPDVEIRPLQWSKTLWNDLSAADLLVYHLGPEPETHGMLWDLARQRGGVMVIHDSHLGELIRVVLTDYQQRPGELRRLLEREMGAYGRYLADDLLSRRLSAAEWTPRVALPAAVTEGALLVVVHSLQLQMRLRPFHPEVHVLNPDDPAGWASGFLQLAADPSHLLRCAAKRQMEAQLRSELLQWQPGPWHERARTMAIQTIRGILGEDGKDP